MGGGDGLHRGGPVGADQELTRPDRLFYDAGCGLCHHAVRFFLRHDPRGTLRFAPLGGETFLRSVPPEVRRDLPDSLVVLTPQGRTLVRAAAVAHLLHRLGGPWSLLGWAWGALPRAVSDRIYEALARNRRRWFRSPGDTCPASPDALRDRFDP